MSRQGKRRRRRRTWLRVGKSEKEILCWAWQAVVSMQERDTDGIDGYLRSTISQLSSGAISLHRVRQDPV